MALRMLIPCGGETATSRPPFLYIHVSIWWRTCALALLILSHRVALLSKCGANSWAFNITANQDSVRRNYIVDQNEHLIDFLNWFTLWLWLTDIPPDCDQRYLFKLFDIVCVLTFLWWNSSGRHCHCVRVIRQHTIRSVFHGGAKKKTPRTENSI